MILALSAGRQAPAELRARLALDEAGQRKLLRSLPSGGEVSGLAVLCTCHRTEIYAATAGATTEALHIAAALLPELRATDHLDLEFMEGAEAIEHLFRVACGLDSLVIGEAQVLGQVRRSYVLAKEEKTAGRVLSRAFDRAIKLGKDVRKQTELGRLGRSIGSTAAAFLNHRLDGLDGVRGAIIGAGEAAADAAKALYKSGADLEVVSRTPLSAGRLAKQLMNSSRTTSAEVASYSLDDLPLVLERSDFAIVAVSGGTLISPSQFPERSPDRPFIVLDLSVPPAVNLDGRNDLEMHTLEDLPGPRGPEITRATAEAELMVQSAVEEIERWSDNRSAGSLIKALRERTEILVREEVTRATGSLDLTEEQRERIETLGLRIANKVLHEPIKALRDADQESIAIMKRLLDLESK